VREKEAFISMFIREGSYNQWQLAASIQLASEEAGHQKARGGGVRST